MKLVGSAALGAALLFFGCGPTGKYVWADQYVEPRVQDTGYQLQPGDVVSVRVLNHDELSAKSKIRQDGRISLAFLNDVDVVGKTPPVLAEALAEKFRSVVNNPVVTVSLEEGQPFTVAVMGEVTRPGNYALDPHSGVLQALASAGGFTQFAHQDRVFVLRKSAPDKAPERIRFTYGQLSRAEGPSASFALRRNDVVVVE